MPSYTYKWRSYRDHRLCDVISPYVYTPPPQRLWHCWCLYSGPVSAISWLYVCEYNNYSVHIVQRSIVMSMSVCACVCLCVCLSTIISLELHVQSSLNFLCMLPMAVFRFFSNGVVIRYVLPVCGWRHICSYAKVARRRRPAVAQCTRSLCCCCHWCNLWWAICSCCFF